MAGSSGGLARAIVRRRGWIAAAWLVACVALLPASRRIESVLDVAARVDGSESAEVQAQLARRFASPFAHFVVLVASGVPAPMTAEGLAALREIVDTLVATPGVTGTISYLDHTEPVFAGAHDRGTFVVVGLTASDRPDTLLVPLRATSERLQAHLRARIPAAHLRWTGELALNADLRRASASDAQRAEQRALPLTLVLLVAAFGALVAALLPIIAGVLAIGVALGSATFAAGVWPLSILLQNVVTMLGLGLGIDYSLLIVSRFREGLRDGLAKEAAAADAVRHAGPTILLSGLAVAIGFAALATTPVNELRSIAVGGLLVVASSVLVATLLLPGLLAWLGHWIDAGRVRRPGRAESPRWERWSRFVTRHPGRVVLCCATPMVFLAWQARHLSTELPRGDWLPREMESAHALRDLQSMERSAVIQGIQVIVELPPSTTALDTAGWSAAIRMAEHLAADSAVANVRSLHGLVAHRAGFLPKRMDPSQVPEEILRSFVRDDDHAVLLEIRPREHVAQPELKALVQRIRTADVAAVTGLKGTALRVGGLPAFNADYERAVAGRFFHVIALVVGATFIVLAVGFRSILVPLKAVVLNLLAVAAAFGAVTLVFQDGIGAAALGLDGALGGIFPAIPVVVFCTVFGLSMDYEVFLVARVREERRAGRTEVEAISVGLVRTGSLITSAAAIMVVVFGAFTLGDFLLIKMLGFALAVAVLLDATVMRLALSPALLALAGRWNWWPGERPESGRSPEGSADRYIQVRASTS